MAVMSLAFLCTIPANHQSTNCREMQRADHEHIQFFNDFFPINNNMAIKSI